MQMKVMLPPATIEEMKRSTPEVVGGEDADMPQLHEFGKEHAQVHDGISAKEVEKDIVYKPEPPPPVANEQLNPSPRELPQLDPEGVLLKPPRTIDKPFVVGFVFDTTIFFDPA